MSPEKLNEFKKLNQVFNLDSIVNAVFNSALTDLPDPIKILVKSKFTTEQLLEKIIAVYDKHLTLEDIQALIQFYNTPIGQKMVSISPQIAVDMITIGQQWGESIAKEVIKDMDQLRDYLN